MLIIIILPSILLSHSFSTREGALSLLSSQNLPVCTPIEDPRASNCSEIWKASSRVGVRTKANKRWGVSSSAFRMGKAKAPVFPEPVSASPMISRPRGWKKKKTSHSKIFPAFSHILYNDTMLAQSKHWINIWGTGGRRRLNRQKTWSLL